MVCGYGNVIEPKLAAVFGDKDPVYWVVGLGNGS